MKCTCYQIVEHTLLQYWQYNWSAKPIFDALKIHQNVQVLKHAIAGLRTFTPGETQAKSLMLSCVNNKDVKSWQTFMTNECIECDSDVAKSKTYICMSGFLTEDNFKKAIYDNQANIDAMHSDSMLKAAQSRIVGDLLPAQEQSEDITPQIVAEQTVKQPEDIQSSQEQIEDSNAEQTEQVQNRRNRTKK